MSTRLRIHSVTGIDLELPVAGPGGRSYAFIIDLHIRFFAALAWLLASALAFTPLTGLAGPSPLYVLLVVTLPAVVIYFLYHPVLEILMNGRTPGKRIAGVRLVTQDGGVPGAGALLIRNVFRLLDSLPGVYMVGLVATIVTRHSVRIGDIAAGTVLVYDEPAPRASLEGLSRGVVDRLGLENAELVRELLERWPRLNPATRTRLARRLLTQLDAEAGEHDEAALKQRLERLLVG